ncbi:MAG: hypothetical protein PHN37_03035, partial [Candidatus Pacebacteria bacterium]|nr:hypothetical protein [Candidatus Paceibacterota bacterium]
MKQGIIIAFGELFLKSDQVQDLFKRRLINHIDFFCKKQKIDFKLIILRDRLFLQTKNVSKVQKILKKIPGISWYAVCYCFEKFNLKEIALFVFENHFTLKNQTFAIKVNMKKD